VDKNLFIVCFTGPLIVIHKIILITPPLAEKEFGFSTIVRKISRMSFELSLPIEHYGSDKTHDYVKNLIKKNGFKISITHHYFNDWDDFFILSRNIDINDIIILVSARKGYVSYIYALDHLPQKFEKHFEKNSKIIIYPQQVKYENTSEGLDELTTISIAKTI
jgi:hypothetical protein